jgi:hypothetical protein
LRSKLRTRLSFANVVSVIALFVALGGSSYAAIKVTGKNVQDSSLTGRDVKNSSLTTSDVKNKSLLAADFKPGQLLGGAQGPKGDTGAKGDTGTVDTSNFYDKAASDGRFLGLHAKSDDADLLDGRDASGFIQGSGRMLFVRKTFETVNALPILTVPGWGTFRAYGDTASDFHRHDFLNQSGEHLSVFVDSGGGDPTWYVPNDGISASSPTSNSTDIVHWMIVRQVDGATQVLNADVTSADWGGSFEITVQAVAQP